MECPKCGHFNDFWGKTNLDGEVIEHYGRKCRGATQDPDTMVITPCGFRFRYKLCHQCGSENDLGAIQCHHCQAELVDASSKLQQARLSKKAHVLTPDTIKYIEKTDKNNNSYLEIRYYDYDSQYLSEVHFFNNPTNLKKFNINFLRSHMKRPELRFDMNTPQEVVQYQAVLRKPSFVIARKQDKFWKITEKIFIEEL